jgi:hypothetical protein
MSLSDSKIFADERVKKGKPTKRQQNYASDVIKLLILSTRRDHKEPAERERDDDDDPARAP